MTNAFRAVPRRWSVLAMLAGVAAVWAAPAAGATRVAVVATPGAADGPAAADVVALELARLGVQTVERDRVASALNEQALTTLLSTDGVGKRKHFGQVLGADALVLLTPGPVTAVRGLHGVVCDTRTGVRLGTFDVPLHAGGFEADARLAAAQAEGVLDRFAGGVRAIVCVSNFLCRNLVHDDDALRQDLATAVRGALACAPGTAVVEIEEARSVRAELDLAGRDAVDADRPVPVAVEGEYRTTRAPDAVPTATLVVRVKRGDRVLKEFAPAAMPLDAAGRFVTQDVSGEVLALTAGPAAVPPMSADAQYDNLVARAKQFAALGDWPTSTALREAALLIRPDAVDPRRDLIREYARRNRQPVEDGQWPADAKQNAADPFWAGVVARSKADWFRSLQHCEYLVRNRKVCREEAIRLCDDAVSSITGVRATSGDQLADCEAFKKRFVRDVFAKVPSLPPATREQLVGMSGALDAYAFCMSAALFRCDGNFFAKDDLDLIADLVTRRLPDPAEPSYQLNFRLRDWGYDERRRSDARSFSTADLDAFLDALCKADRPLARVYGRYGRLMRRLGTRDADRAALYAEATAIVSLAQNCGFDPKRFDYFMGQLRDEAARLAPPETSQKPAPTLPARRRQTATSAPASALTFEPIPLTLKAKANDKDALTPAVRWRAPGGWGGITQYRPAGPALDLFWTSGALLFMSEPGVAREVLADDKLALLDVVFDGKYVWAVSAYDRGIFVLDATGNVVARIGKAQGLPPISHFGAFLLPLGEGRVMAVGTFGNEYRSWLATIDLDAAGHGGKVKVFHEATTVRDYAKGHDGNNADPTMTFRPSYLVGHTTAGPKPTRLAFVGRDNYDPLVVDVATQKVWAYPARTWKDGFPRNQARAEAFASIDGTLYLAGGGRGIQRYRMPDPNGLLMLDRKIDGWGMGGVTSGVLARVGNGLYIAGADWRRLDLATGQEQVLIDNPRALPDYGSGGDWLIGNSGLYGLVAFHNGTFYRVK